MVVYAVWWLPKIDSTRPTEALRLFATKKLANEYVKKRIEEVMADAKIMGDNYTEEDFEEDYLVECCRVHKSKVVHGD